MNARPLRYLGAPLSIVAHAPCIHIHDTDAQHDITRFTYDVNHTTVMSPAFAFHLCHIGMRWHYIIGVFNA